MKNFSNYALCFDIGQALTSLRRNELNFPMEIWLPLTGEFWFSHGIKYKLIKNRIEAIPFISTNTGLTQRITKGVSEDSSYWKILAR